MRIAAGEPLPEPRLDRSKKFEIGTHDVHHVFVEKGLARERDHEPMLGVGQQCSSRDGIQQRSAQCGRHKLDAQMIDQRLAQELVEQRLVELDARFAVSQDSLESLGVPLFRQLEKPAKGRAMAERRHAALHEVGEVEPGLMVEVEQDPAEQGESGASSRLTSSKKRSVSARDTARHYTRAVTQPGPRRGESKRPWFGLTRSAHERMYGSNLELERLWTDSTEGAFGLPASSSRRARALRSRVSSASKNE